MNETAQAVGELRHMWRDTVGGLGRFGNDLVTHLRIDVAGLDDRTPAVADEPDDARVLELDNAAMVSLDQIH